MASEDAIKVALEKKGQALDDRLDAHKNGEENCIGIRLDVFRKIIDEIDADPQLREVFGGEVSSKLGLISLRNDLKISELKLVDLTDEGGEVFLKRVRTILRKHLTREAK